MTEPVTPPPLPGHPEPHTYCWTKLELEEISAYGKKCFEAGSKQAIEECIAAAEGERLTDNLLEPSDHSYNLAIDHVTDKLKELK